MIGRSNTWDADRLRGLHGLNRRLVGITVMTYDQLLAQGERLISMLSETVTQDEAEPDIEEFHHASADDIPF